MIVDTLCSRPSESGQEAPPLTPGLSEVIERVPEYRSLFVSAPTSGLDTDSGNDQSSGLGSGPESFSVPREKGVGVKPLGERAFIYRGPIFSWDSAILDLRTSWDLTILNLRTHEHSLYPQVKVPTTTTGLSVSSKGLDLLSETRSQRDEMDVTCR